MPASVTNRRNAIDFMVRSLFVTNDALSGHIGKAQILPYLEGLSASGNTLSCISVEPRASSWDPSGEWKERLAASRIKSHVLHRSDGKYYAIERFIIPQRLRITLGKVIESASPDLLHCRSYAPLMAVMSAARRYRLPYIFDMRGFWIDQRVEGGFWNMNSWIWRHLVGRLRAIESKAIGSANAIVTLTRDARDIITARPDYRGSIIEVIPSSVQTDIFRPLPDGALTRARLGIKSNSRVIAYLGSAGPLYRTDVVYRLWQAMMDRGTDTSILFIGDHLMEQHADFAAKIGVQLDRTRTFFVKCPHREIPSILSAANIGVSPIIQSFSSLGVSATKSGEYLCCGIPVISNDGVGDIRSVIKDGQNGFVLPDFSDSSIARCVEVVTRGLSGRFLPASEISRRASMYFSMDRAVTAYGALYRRLSGYQQ